LTIRYTERIDGKITFFELSPLITALRTLLTTGRPLRPTDLVPAAGSAAVDRSLDDAVTVTRRRPEAVRDALHELADDVAGYITDVARLYPASPAPPKRADVLDRIDSLLTRYAELVTTAAGFGAVRSGWGELTTWRRGVFSAVLAAVATVADRMAGALAAANTLLTAYDALPKSTPDVERIRLLRQAERLVVTTPAVDPKTPNEFRSAVRHKRDDFADRLKDLKDVAGTDTSHLSDLLDEVGRLLPLTAFDPTGLDLTATQDQVVDFGRELLTRARALQAEIAGRLAAAATALTGFDQAVTPPDRTKAAIEALRAMLGTDVLVVPEYALPDQLAEDLHDALDGSDDLVKHLTQAPVNRDFPVDDWLHGIARVRDMPRLWERVVLLSDALRGHDGLLGNDAENDDDTRLQPIQLPLRSRDHWLGMEFAAGADLTEDRLLFTAHYATQPSRDADSECGLLFDEWTEVIPTDRETTSIAVHADSPDSEPPQAMLLVTPPVKTGTWAADDLVAAVNETFDLAKTRLVEPVHLDDTGYAQLLPATVLSATRQPITISTDLAIANTRWKADHE